MPPYIFEVGLKVITKVYLDVLKTVVIPWYNQVSGGRPWMWQQDSAPTHKSKVTGPFFPRPEPVDYLVWSYVENITKMTSPNTKDSLITAIRRVFAEPPPALVEKACSHFRILIEAATEAEAATLNRCQPYCIIKLSELIFSIKVLK